MSENGYGQARRGDSRGRRGGDRGDRGYGPGGRYGDRRAGRRDDGSGYRSGRSRRVYDDEPRDGALSDLVGHLHALDDRSYAAYKAIVGRYEAPEGWVLFVDRVQPDPYAPPTRIRVEVPADLPGLEVLEDRDLLTTEDRRLAVRDFLTRELHAAFKGTNLSIASPGQEILERSAVVALTEEPEDEREPLAASAWTLQVRARVALPARGRSIQGHEAARIISRDRSEEHTSELQSR